MLLKRCFFLFLFVKKVSEKREKINFLSSLKRHEHTTHDQQNKSATPLASGIGIFIQDAHQRKTKNIEQFVEVIT